MARSSDFNLLLQTLKDRKKDIFLFVVQAETVQFSFMSSLEYNVIPNI